MDWLESIVRFLFAWIDKIIAWVIEQAYSLFILISDTNIFNQQVLEMFSRRVYALLAIFMLFKLAFSLINYIINPDDFTDKSKGAAKLITNVFIVLGLIVTVPYMFKLAYDFQGLVVKNSVIQKVVLGVGGASVKDDQTPGKIMAFTVYSAFVTPNPNYPGMDDKCDELYSKREVSPDCEDIVRSAAGPNGPLILKNAVDAYDSQSLLNYDLIVNAKTNKQFLFNYTPIISSICAGIVAWIILIFCIDIAIRVVKLGFLQLIAPIPIISYVDPKSSKEGMFKKWTKICFSTYADLFVRLIAISFAIFIINIIGTGEITKISKPDEVISFTTHPFVKIFILLGALMFAKQIPKLIEDLTGVKMGDSFTLNPMKKVGASPFAAAALGGVGGLVGGGLANAYAAGSNMRKTIGEKGLRDAFTGGKTGVRGFMHGAGTVFGGAGTVIAGGASGMFRGGGAAAKDKNVGGGIVKGIKGSVDARDIRDARQEADYGIATRGMDTIRGMAGVDTQAKERANEIKGKITNLQRQQAQYDSIAENIAVTNNYTPEKITQLSQASRQELPGGVVQYRDAAGATITDANEIKYLEAVTRSSKTSVEIIKTNKKLKIYEAENNKKTS
jgi:hypothetical protein